MDHVLIAPNGRYVLTGNNVGLDLSDRPLECRGEWIDLDAAMEMLGAPGTDEEKVQALIAEITAMINAYLGRNVLDCTHTDYFYRPVIGTLYLNNWPVTAWHSIRFDGVRGSQDGYVINPEEGFIQKNCSAPFAAQYYCGNVTVNYDAGYATPPRELESMFRALLVDYYTLGGSAEGSVGSVKKVSLTGVAAVEFNNPSGVTYSGIDRQLGVPNPLKNYTGLLDRYKSDRVMGVI